MVYTHTKISLLTPESRIETSKISRENLMDSILEPDFADSSLSILHDNI